MNSWYQLMLLKMAGGQYLNLSQRPTNQYDWLALWGLVQADGQLVRGLDPGVYLVRG